MAKKAPPLSETQRDRLDAEWMFLNATREGMNIFRRQPDQTTYKQAVRWGEKIAPEILHPDRRILNGFKESADARYFREKAKVETTLAGEFIYPQDLVAAEIAELKTMTLVAPEAELLGNRLTILEKVLQELNPTKHSENQVIFRDANKVERYLPETGSGKDYNEYSAGDDRVLRVRVLHPDHPESKIGADLVYEMYNVQDETVRVVFLQYKMWDRKELP